MSIFYFLFEVVPSPEGENFDQYGGAFVSCWVQDQESETAREVAIAAVQQDGWLVEELKEAYVADESFYEDDITLMEAYKQATQEGQSYIYFTWTPEPQSGDTIH